MIWIDIKSTFFGIQETHLRGTGIETITSNEGKQYSLFYTGPEDNSYHGIGIMVSSCMNPSFQRQNLCG